MPHDLEMLANGKASMFYNLDTGVPWHALGTPVKGVATAAEAIVAADLDHIVVKEQAERKGVPVPGKFWTVRESDDKVLGSVGKDYKVIQNSEAFEFFDNLVDSGEAKYDTAGSLSGGKRIWLTAQVGEDIQVAGQDSHRLYLALLSSHDGSKSLTALTTMVRIVCANTEQMALSSAKTSWTMTHRQSLAGKVAEARDALQLSFKYRDEFDKEMQKLLAIKVSNDQFRAILTDVLPKQKRQLEKNLTLIGGIFENSPTIHDAGLANTGMGAYNAITEYLTWGREVRSQEARMVNSLWGFGQQTRNKAHKRIMAMAD